MSGWVRMRARADAVVVGSGAGGAAVAAALAEGGMRVVVLEEGEQWDPADFTARSRDMNLQTWRDGGQLVTVGGNAIVLPVGRALGGTTTFNSATCFRPPAALLHRWAAEEGLHAWCGAELDPYLCLVERMLNVHRVSRELAGRNAQLMERGAQALGWSGEYLHRAARGCIGSGVCASGCPADAKLHAGNTFMPAARIFGAQTVTGARVTRVLTSGGRATGVVARTGAGGRLRVDAPLVVVAAGTLGTPILLRASGIRRSGLGRNLSLHPATGVWAEHAEPVDMARGVPQSYAVDEFAREGFVLEGWSGSPDMLALALPTLGAEHRRVLRNYRRVAHAGLMIRDRTRGSVHRVAGRTMVRYDLGQGDVALLVRAIAAAAELELAAGAHIAHVPVRGFGPIRGRADLERLRAARPPAGALALTAYHPLGTARASADPARGAVDADLRVHGLSGLLVADGAAVPSALGVNPQLTIMALATRAAYGLLDKAPPHDEPAPASVGRAAALVAT